MKKILIIVLTILLTVMACVLIIKGISIGKLSILSVEQIIDENDKLTDEIAQTELLMYNSFKSRNDELEKSVSQLLNVKKEYEELASISTEAQIDKASTEEKYTVEFLWTKLGGYATSEGVDLVYTISNGIAQGLSNINFTVTGDYIPIINFISAIEDDSRLGFRIENFKLNPSGDKLVANFTTKNLYINLENTSANVNFNNENTFIEKENTENAENVEETENIEDE